jgi:hypothetical protein
MLKSEEKKELIKNSLIYFLLRETKENKILKD